LPQLPFLRDKSATGAKRKRSFASHFVVVDHVTFHDFTTCRSHNALSLQADCNLGKAARARGGAERRVIYSITPIYSITLSAQCGRDGDAKSFCGLDVYEQVNFRRLLDFLALRMPPA